MIDFKRLSNTKLQQIGIFFDDPAEAKLFADFVLEELEVKIGEQISNGMSQDQLQEFDRITNQKESVRWLERNKPNYRDIVEREQIEMAWNLLKNREKISHAHIRKEIDDAYRHIYVLNLKPFTYKCLTNAKLNYIDEVLKCEHLRNISGIDDYRELEIKTCIVNYLIPNLTSA